MPTTVAFLNLILLLLSIVGAISNPVEQAHADYHSSKNGTKIIVLDLRQGSDDGRLDTPTLLAVQACAGLSNRNGSTTGAVYTVWDTLDWFHEIEHNKNPPFMPIHDFLVQCYQTVGRYIHYNYETQHAIIPNIITLASVLDAIPLIQNDGPATTAATPAAYSHQMKLVFDAETKFAGFTPYDATSYMFQHYASKTTGMAKMDPGYDYSHKSPRVTKQPNLRLADYIVKQRLFNFFLLDGCIPMTQEHALMEEMVQHHHPNTTQWLQPIAIYGYDDYTVPGIPGSIFEAETTCVKEHNLGQVATAGVPNLSFWSRKPPITTPVVQNRPSASINENYNASQTYVGFVLGDGDNVAFLRSRNYPWVQERLSKCHNNAASTTTEIHSNNNIDKNCFPISWTISPHSLYLLPDILAWYYAQAQKTGHDYFVLPPSGYLYAYPAMMSDDDQISFVSKTIASARLLNTSGMVDWELASTWKTAIHQYFPRFAAVDNTDTNNIIRGIFSVNVPFNVPVFAFGRHEFYKIIRDSDDNGDDSAVTTGDSKKEVGATVLFRPREWRGTSGKGNKGVPFSRKQNLSPSEMAAEISQYPKGTVTYLYLTSDGGANLTSLYDMVPYLDNHVQVVDHETLTKFAMEAAKMKKNVASAS